MTRVFRGTDHCSENFFIWLILILMWHRSSQEVNILADGEHFFKKMPNIPRHNRKWLRWAKWNLNRYCHTFKTWNYFEPSCINQQYGAQFDLTRPFPADSVQEVVYALDWSSANHRAHINIQPSTLTAVDNSESWLVRISSSDYGWMDEHNMHVLGMWVEVIQLRKNSTRFIEHNNYSYKVQSAVNKVKIRRIK